MDALTKAVATLFGSGHFPFAPATFASLLVVLALWFLPPLSPTAWVVLILVVAAIGIPASTRAERWFGHDGSPIVIDEVLGMAMTVAFLPKYAWVYVAGFFLFRLFDIVKPFPAGRAQHLPAGWGVMLDDAMAAVYAHLVLRALLAFF
jgi:phosphatidylglycerophosphatase A